MGVASEKDAPSITAMANGMNETPSSSAAASAIGSMSTAPALAVTTQASSIAETKVAASINPGVAPKPACRALPRMVANPELVIACPRPSAPPSTSSTSQSIARRAVLALIQPDATVAAAATTAAADMESTPKLTEPTSPSMMTQATGARSELKRVARSSLDTR